MATCIVLHVKHFTWRRGEDHACPDCGGGLTWFAKAHSVGCRRCGGWGKVTGNVDLLVTWQPAYRGTLKVRFWSPSHEPEKALDPLDNYLGDYGPLDNSFEVSTTGQVADWRPAKPRTTLADMGNFMREHSLDVVKCERVAHRNNGRRCGCYELTIGPRKDGALRQAHPEPGRETQDGAL